MRIANNTFTWGATIVPMCVARTVSKMDPVSLWAKQTICTVTAFSNLHGSFRWKVRKTWETKPLEIGVATDPHSSHQWSTWQKCFSVPRPGPRKRIFQEDEMGDFLVKDRIKDFESLSKSVYSCASTLWYQND